MDLMHMKFLQKKYICEKTSIENIDVSIKSTLHKKLNIFQ